MPVENDQRAQRDENQARQPQAEDVALGVVRGARACGASKGVEAVGVPARPVSPPVLWVSNLQGGAENAPPVSTPQEPRGSRA